MNKAGTGIFAFLTGISLGIVAGLLLAPEAGKDTQDKLSQKAKKWGGDLEHQAESGRKKINEVAEQIGKKANELMS
ncbi:MULTISPECIES: YtxH domain-containing protein [Persicobacter]|uniref:YtxH domain-containing protein n=1 Tax=Persicobacter diffluens TaxID=981 RepID=A0AAN5AIL7_9BACT|nr:YtxH domain-containing protein [Persicobacter sp. CCB-QB2]GJM60024.1 hypothetical protein PEDI_05760 [Persicobacter diffluens]